MNGLEDPDELLKKTLTQQATQQNPEKPKPPCHHYEKPSHYRNQCYQLKREKYLARNNTNSADNNNHSNSGQTNSNSNIKIPKNTNAKIINNQKERRPRHVYPHCETCGKNQPFHREMLLWRRCSEQIASPEQTTGRTKSSPTEKCPKQLRR